MHRATCRFEIAYAHRLPAHSGQCRRLHGHNGIVEITLKSPGLDSAGMVADFGVIKAKAGAWLSENLDHKTILSKNDTLASALEKAGEPVFLIDGEPTAENLAALIFEEVSPLLAGVEEVRFAETSRNFASYKKND